jgi:hypothetical protein
MAKVKLLQIDRFKGKLSTQLEEQQAIPKQTVEFTKDEMQSFFFLQAYSWQAWASNASILRESAHVLWKIVESENIRIQSMGDDAIGQYFDLEHKHTAMMLMGMSLEALLKGCLIVKNPKLVDHQRIGKLKTHNLVDLFKRALITLNEYEKKYCNTLTDYIRWEGRYPIPVDVNQVPTTRFFLIYQWQPFDLLYTRVLDSVSAQEIDQANQLFYFYSDKFFAQVKESHGVKKP